MAHTWRQRRYLDWGEFVPAVHYKIKGTSLCGVQRAKINGTVYTTRKSDVTCKNCLKKIKKGGYVEDHFEEELFVI